MSNRVPETPTGLSATGNRPRVLLMSEYGVLNGGEHSLLAILAALQNGVESGKTQAARVGAGHLDQSTLSGRDLLSSISSPSVPQPDSSRASDPARQRSFVFEACVPINSPLEAALQSLGIQNRGLTFYDDQQQRLSQTTIRLHLEEAIQQAKPDLVHGNSLAMSRLMGPVCRALNVPSVGYLRDIYRLSKQAVHDLNQVDGIIAVSQATREFHQRQGVDGDRIRVIYNGVDAKQFAPLVEAEANGNEGSTPRAQLDVPNGDRVVLFVGQLGMRKGLDLVADAFHQLSQQDSQLHLWIVGQRNSQKQEAVDFENAVRRRLQPLVESRRVHWLGRRQDVPALMRDADLLIHPARQEPLGRVLLEAFASGLPVVATRVGGTEEIFTGACSRLLLVDKDDLESIVRQASDLLANPVLRAKVATEIRQIAKQRFSVRQCAVAVAQVYSNLLAGQSETG